MEETQVMTNEEIQFECAEQFMEVAKKEKCDAHSFKRGFERGVECAKKEIIERALNWMPFNVEECLYINDHGVYEVNDILLEDRFRRAMEEE